MEMLNVQITSLSIWVKFYNIPLEYWTGTCLGYIASVVGIPLHLDTLTENHSRLSFARICIKVDVNCVFPKDALLDLGNGKYSTIRIEYPWVPQNCSHCKIFGHSRLKCHVVKEMDTHDSETIICPDHKDSGPATGYVAAAGSVSGVTDIGDPITTPVKAGKVKDVVIPIRLTGNTFECLAICDDAGTQEVAVERGPSGYGSPTIPVVSNPLAGVVSPLSGVGSLNSSKPQSCRILRHVSYL